LKFGILKISEIFQDREIDYEVANRDAGAGSTLSRLKDSEGKVFEWEMRIAWNVNERFEGLDRLASLEDFFETPRR
jgi:hypothetical protein